VQIIDVDLDGRKDIVKSDDDPGFQKLLILYNDAGNVGHFDIRHDVENEYPGIQETYMVAAGDINADFGVDLYQVSGALFRADRFLIAECYQADPLPPECDVNGKVQFLPARSVGGGPGTTYYGGNPFLYDMDGDNLLDVVRSDLDVAAKSCGNNLRVLYTTTDPLDPRDVTVKDPSNSAVCAWNTPRTYDAVALDINGDSKPDLWSGNAAGNHVFLQEIAVDCNEDGVADRCDSKSFGSWGGENPVAACCLPTGSCFDTFQVCCDEQGGHFESRFSCVTFGCMPGP
jgi:hypothetical protein